MSSTKKPSSQKRADRERQDNRTLNRVYYVFLLGLAAECYLILAYRGFALGNIGSTLAWNKFLNVAMWVGLALLAAGAGINQKDSDGQTPLILAARGGRNDFTAMLIETGADVNSVDNDQHSALFYASEAGYTEIVEQLLLAGAEN